jgi:hypothetical protein
VSETDPTTKAEGIAWVRRSLGEDGDCGIKVELSDGQFETAWGDAVRWYVGRKGVTKTHAFTLSGSVDLTVPADCDEVLDVAFPGRGYDNLFAAGAGYDLIGQTMLPVSRGGGMNSGLGMLPSGLYQTSQHLEMARRVFGSDPTWEWDRSTRKLQVFPGRQASGAAVVKYKSTTLDDATLANLSFRERDLILRYAKAKAQMMLGYRRRKFSEWPSAQNPKRLDGPEMVQEAQAEIEKLNEEILVVPFAAPFLTG